MKLSELLRKYSLEIAIVGTIAILSSVIIIAGNSCTDEEIKEEQTVKQEEQVPTPEYVSPKEKETTNNLKLCLFLLFVLWEW